MSIDHPGRWLVHQTKTAVAEFPENAGWLLRKVLTPPPVERAMDEARGGARRLSESIADAVPFGGDSLDLRLQRARRPLRTQSAPRRRALQRMGEANELLERVKTVAANGRRRLQEAKAAGDAATKRRVAEAQRRANAMVAEERAAAEADASRHLDEVAAQNEAEAEDAQRDGRRTPATAPRRRWTRHGSSWRRPARSPTRPPRQPRARRTRRTAGPAR